MASHPVRMVSPRGPFTQPTGRLSAPGEHAPADGIIMAWSGGAAINQISAQMIRHITTTGAAKVYLVFTSAATRDAQMNSPTSTLRVQNPDLSRIVPIVAPLNAVWMRDYGPRYVYEGDCRVIVDHRYNVTSRTLDDAFPTVFAPFKRHAIYAMNMLHGGGNYHLDSEGNGFATRLVVNENPSLGASGVVNTWRNFQGVETTLFDPFPTSVDATQHIDMWLQVASDDTVFVSQWPSTSGTPFTVTEAAASSLASRGYRVFRLPARRLTSPVSGSGTHYTYTNMVIVNDLILLPTYSNTTMASGSPSLNQQALDTVRAAMPGKTVVQIPCENLVYLSGVMHCIVMHVPVNRNGASPGVHLRTMHSGAAVLGGPGGTLNDVRWISDDDVLVTSVDVELSLDGGFTWRGVVAGTADDGQHGFVAPSLATRHASVRVTARDAEGNTGSDQSDAVFTISTACAPDYTGNGLNIDDVFVYLNDWFAGSLRADWNGAGGVTLDDLFIYLNAWFAGC
jgi:agmatine/peptidylarginine deiminase